MSNQPVLAQEPPDGMEVKYRPYLSLNQMNRILSVLGETHNKKDIDDSIRAALQIIIFKANGKMIKPASIPIAAKLGLNDIPDAAKQREAVYNKWLIPSQRILLSKAELDAAEEYRYMNGLMNEKDKSNYELSLLGIQP